MLLLWTGHTSQSGAAVALEVILDSRDGGFEGLLGVVERWREREGGVFASCTPAQARKRFGSSTHGRRPTPGFLATANKTFTTNTRYPPLLVSIHKKTMGTLQVGLGFWLLCMLLLRVAWSIYYMKQQQQ